MTELDPLIHPPARLHMMSILSTISEAEFSTLRTNLHVSDSVLSKHIAALTEARYLTSRKATRAGRRTTWVGLTPQGRDALRSHVAELRRLFEPVED